MKLNINGIENEIDFRNKINILEIHDTKLYTNTIYNLNNCIKYNYDPENINLYENENLLNIYKNMLILIDIFNIDINSKIILNKLYLEIERISKLDNEIDQDFNKISKKIIIYLKDKLNELPFEYTLNENIEIKDLLKITSIKFDSTKYETLLDQLLFYIDVIVEFKITNILTLINIKNYFTSSQLNTIYEYCLNKDLSILLIENNHSNLLKYEKKLTISSEFDDFCE